jgi:hypothetical protein
MRLADRDHQRLASAEAIVVLMERSSMLVIRQYRPQMLDRSRL